VDMCFLTRQLILKLTLTSKVKRADLVLANISPIIFSA